MAPLGCGPTLVLDEPTDDGGTTTAGAGVSVGEGAATSGATPPSATTAASGVVTTGVGDTASDGAETADTTDDSDSAFILRPEWGCGALPDGTMAHCSPLPDCDLWEQDCPDGEKCMPWANDGGGSWNATRCTEVADDPGAVGDPCSVEGSGVSGVDDCDLGAMCFYVDPETNDGTCVALCMGSPQRPICDEGSSCTISAEGTLNVCLPTCNPLVDDCPQDQVCAPNSADFWCVPQAGEPVPVGEACEFLGQCISGSACIDAGAAGCDEGNGCCSPHCDLADADPDAPCTAEQTCTAWFEEGGAPPGLQSLGVCVVE